MSRTRRLAVAVAASTAALGLLVPATAYGEGSGEVVQPAATPVAAPLVSPGVHDYRFPDNDDAHHLLVERSMPGSTMWVSAFATTGDPVAASAFLRMAPADTAEPCGDDVVSLETYYEPVGLFSGVVWSRDACQSTDRLMVSSNGRHVSRLADADARLVVWEEPPVTDASLLSPPAIALNWSSEQPPITGIVELGTGFADAPEIGDGRHTVRITPDTTVLFRVPLDWNQHLQLELTHEGARTRESSRIVPVLLNPLGGRSEWGIPENAPGVTGEAPFVETLDLAHPGVKAGAVSPSITWRNRERPGVTAAFAGDHYVALLPVDVTEPVDVVLSTQVITDQEPRSPYTENGDPVPDLSGADTETATDSTGTAAEAGPGTPWPWVSGLLGGAVVMAVAGALALNRHRRTRG